MRHEFYDYSQDEKGRYRFTSRGKRAIIKVVGFTTTGQPDIYNLWFGDLLPDDTIDDMVISNNGDMVKVLATVIQITREFMAEQSHMTVVFKGNTVQRMALYQRILKIYYAEFASQFFISAFILDEGRYREILLDGDINSEYWAFFVQRKD